MCFCKYLLNFVNTLETVIASDMEWDPYTAN